MPIHSDKSSPDNPLLVAFKQWAGDATVVEPSPAPAAPVSVLDAFKESVRREERQWDSLAQAMSPRTMEAGAGEQPAAIPSAAPAPNPFAEVQGGNLWESYIGENPWPPPPSPPPLTDEEITQRKLGSELARHLLRSSSPKDYLEPGQSPLAQQVRRRKAAANIEAAKKEEAWQRGRAYIKSRPAARIYAGGKPSTTQQFKTAFRAGLKDTSVGLLMRILNGEGAAPIPSDAPKAASTNALPYYIDNNDKMWIVDHDNDVMVPVEVYQEAQDLARMGLPGKTLQNVTSVLFDPATYLGGVLGNAAAAAGVKYAAMGAARKALIKKAEQAGVNLGVALGTMEAARNPFRQRVAKGPGKFDLREFGEDTLNAAAMGGVVGSTGGIAGLLGEIAAFELMGAAQEGRSPSLNGLAESASVILGLRTTGAIRKTFSRNKPQLPVEYSDASESDKDLIDSLAREIDRIESESESKPEPKPEVKPERSPINPRLTVEQAARMRRVGYKASQIAGMKPEYLDAYEKVAKDRGMEEKKPPLELPQEPLAPPKDRFEELADEVSTEKDAIELYEAFKERWPDNPERAQTFYDRVMARQKINPFRLSREIGQAPEEAAPVAPRGEVGQRASVPPEVSGAAPIGTIAPTGQFRKLDLLSPAGAVRFRSTYPTAADAIAAIPEGKVSAGRTSPFYQLRELAPEAESKSWSKSERETFRKLLAQELSDAEAVRIDTQRAGGERPVVERGEGPRSPDLQRNEGAERAKIEQQTPQPEESQKETVATKSDKPAMKPPAPAKKRRSQYVTVRKGLKAAGKVLTDWGDRNREMIEGEPPDVQGVHTDYYDYQAANESPYRRGYTFRQGSMTGEVQMLKESLPEKLRNKGHVKVVKPGDPGYQYADGADIVGEIGIDAMAESIIRFHEQRGRPAGSLFLERVLAHIEENPRMAPPEMILAAKNYRQIEQYGEYETVKANELQVGDEFEIAGERFYVRELMEDGSVFVEDGVRIPIEPDKDILLDKDSLQRGRNNAGFDAAEAEAETIREEAEAAKPKTRADMTDAEIEAMVAAEMAKSVDLLGEKVKPKPPEKGASGGQITLSEKMDTEIELGKEETRQREIDAREGQANLFVKGGKIPERKIEPKSEKRAKLERKIEKADEDIANLFKEIKDHIDTNLPMGVDPQLVNMAARLVAAYTKKGVLKFEDVYLKIAESLPEHIDRLKPALESGWNALRKIDPRLGPVTEIKMPPLKPPVTPPPSKAPMGAGLGEFNLKVTQHAGKSGKPYWDVTGGGTYDNRDVLKAAGGRFKGYNKAWRFFDGDPTEKIVSALAKEGRTGSAEERRKSGGIRNPNLERERREQDARADASGTGRDSSEFAGTETAELLRRGEKHNIPKEIIDEQIEDVALITHAREQGKGAFILASEAGSGKTFVLGGAIRELQKRGNKRIIYVTPNQRLIKQIKADLADYGIDDVEFVTYAGIRKSPPNTRGAVLIFDEAHSVKNTEGSQQGRIAARMIRDSAYTIFASATPFENPVQAAYLEPTGIFKSVGGHFRWAEMYGATVKEFRNPATGETIRRLEWSGGRRQKENQFAAREWFRKQGVFTQRKKKLPKGTIQSRFHRVTASKKDVDTVDGLSKAYARANQLAENKQEAAQIKMHYVNVLKRTLEASKVKDGIKRARELIDKGHQVVLFVETKSDRILHQFRKSGRATGPRYSYPQMAEMMREWQAQKRFDPSVKPPFAGFIMKIAEAMHETGFRRELPSVADAIRAAFGKDAATYTGEISDAKASKELDAWLAGNRKVLIATMAKGGTGLSLHDTTGDMPHRVQVGINLPWSATQVEQVSGRLARYGAAKPVGIEWIFADNIPFEQKLSNRVGARMVDMGAIVKGVEVREAEAISDFDYDFKDLPISEGKGVGPIAGRSPSKGPPGVEPTALAAKKRPIRPTGEKRIPVAPILGVEPKSLRSIELDLAKETGETGLGQKVRTAKPARGALGTYYPSTTRKVIRYANDLDTTAHEVAHSLDDLFDIVGAWAKEGVESPYDSELIPRFSQHGSVAKTGPRSKLVYVRAEGVAEWLRAYMVNPKAAYKAAPRFAKFFFTKVPNATVKKINAFGKQIRGYAGLDPMTRTSMNIQMEPEVESPRDRARAVLGELDRTVLDQLSPLWGDIKDVRKLSGRTEPLPEADPKMAFLRYGAEGRKIQQYFAGPFDADGRDIEGLGELKTLFEPLDTSSKESLDRDLVYLAAYMTNERIVAEGRKLDAHVAKIKEANKTFQEGKAELADIEKQLADMRAAIEETADAKTRKKLIAERKKLMSERNGLLKMINEASREISRRKKSIGYKGKIWKLDIFAANKKARITGTGGGIFSDTEQAQEAIAEFKKRPAADRKRIKTAADLYRKWATAILQYARDKGRISTELFDKLMEDKDYYADLHRILTELDPTITHTTSTSRSLLKSSEIVHLRKGSTRTIRNPYISLIEKIHHIIRESDKNEAKRLFADEFRSDPERKMYEKDRINYDAIASKAEGPGPNTIKYYRNGKPEYLTVQPETYKALDRWGEAGPNELPYLAAQLPGKIMRYSIVESPPFVARNLLKDPWHRAVVGKSMPWSNLGIYIQPFTSKGRAEFKKMVREAQIHGLAGFGYYPGGPKGYNRTLREAMHKASRRSDTILTTPIKFIRWWENLAEWSELAGRLVENKTLLKYAREELGYNEKNAKLFAADGAREIMNYRRTGTATETLNRYFPFTSAGVVGTTTVARAIKNKPQRVAARWAATTGMMTAANYLWNWYTGDEDELNQQPAYLRDMFWSYKIAPDTILRIPKAWELAIPAFLIKRSADKIRGKPHAFEGAMKSTINAMAPLDESALLGPYRAIGEMLGNWDFFRDKYIVPPWQSGLDLELRKGTTSASRIGRFLQPFIGIDRRKIDHFINTELGGLGRIATKASDVGREDRPGAAKSLAMETAGIFVRAPSYAARDVQWAMDFAKRRGLSQIPELKVLYGKLDRAREAPTAKERDDAKAEVRRYAIELRKLLPNIDRRKRVIEDVAAKRIAGEKNPKQAMNAWNRKAGGDTSMKPISNEEIWNLLKRKKTEEREVPDAWRLRKNPFTRKKLLEGAVTP